MEYGEILAYGLPVFLVVLFPLFLINFTYLHLFFPKNINAELFTEKHYSQLELEVFSKFPLSLIKTLSYVGGTVLPKLYYKRFQYYNFKVKIPISIYISCYLLFFLAIIASFYIFLLLVWGIINVI